MRSSSRNVVALVGLLVLLATGTGTANDDQTRRIERAIALAVSARLGVSADVRVEVGQVRLRDENEDVPAFEARPVPGARLGRPTRFALYRTATDSRQDAQRVGYAVAQAHATLPHLRTTHAISRGTVLTADDVVLTEAEVGPIALKPLPTLDEVVGATLARQLGADALVQSTAIRLPTLVRSGDQVITRVRVGIVVVAGRTTATGSGQLGDVIGLLNEHSGRRLRGRVVAQGEVEVVQ